MHTNKLLVFIKNPVIGTVKTRLAASIGEKEALDVYLELLSITFQAVIGVKATTQLWFSTQLEKANSFFPEALTQAVQTGDDLGDRMKNAFDKSFEEEYQKVVIIGSDCPTINTELLTHAFDKLDVHDIIIGPSKDGGYYLLGMKKFHPELFKGIEWSSDRVLTQTLKIAEELKLSTSFLIELNDIDTVSDLQEFRNQKSV